MRFEFENAVHIYIYAKKYIKKNDHLLYDYDLSREKLYEDSEMIEIDENLVSVND